MHLSCLPPDLVNLSSGAMVHIPAFVSQSASCLLKHIDLEGIFRKAGSKTRQREISTRVDNGGALEAKDHGIDIANCLKTFLQVLPEPLIPFAFHDLFVRCVVLKENRVEALLSACLLLPSLHLNTLAFLMEFLKKVASYEELNKMGVVNLATVFAPNIMPLRETTMLAVQSRLETHLTVVQLLIENAEKIGILPDHVTELISADGELVGSTETDRDQSDSNVTKGEKKRHRSRSFTRMLSGLKKMVGRSSSPLDSQPISEPSNSVSLYTPSLKIGKKRKEVGATIDEANLKKKKSSEKIKKWRLCFDRFVSRSRQKLKEAATVKSKEEPISGRGKSSNVASRHSESKKKRRSDESTHQSSSRDKKIPKLSSQKEYDDVLMDANINLSDVGDQQASREDKKPKRIHNSKRRVFDFTLPPVYTIKYISNDKTSLEGSSVIELKDNNRGEEYVKIPKSEYLEIKSRVSAIEPRISQEFNKPREILTTDSVTKVKSEYEKTSEEASIENTMNADHLAKRLGNELKIRRSGEHKIIKSPSDRKIGVLRRSSQEKPVSKRVSRTSSWHISDRTESQSLRRTTLKMNNFYSNTHLNHRSSDYSKSEDLAARTDSFCSEETNASLTYLHEQLNTLITHTAEHSKGSLSDSDYSSINDKVFQPIGNKINFNLKVKRASVYRASEFIDNSRYINERIKELKKSNSHQNVDLNNESLPSEEKVITWKDAEKYFRSKGQIATRVPVTGRESVAKLRIQNAGMVLAKAKFFNETTGSSSQSKVPTERRIIHIQDTNRRQSAGLKEIKILDLDITDSPRRTAVLRKNKSSSPENPSAKIRITKSPNANKMELTLVPSQETLLHRKHSDAKRSSGCQKENKGTILQELNVYNPDMNCKTPLIKKQLSVKTPRSTKSLARRPAVEVRRTPLKAILPLATPRQQSPRSILKTSHLNSRRFS